MYKIWLPIRIIAYTILGFGFHYRNISLWLIFAIIIMMEVYFIIDYFFTKNNVSKQTKETVDDLRNNINIKI